MINTEIYKYVTDALFNTPDILFHKNKGIDNVIDSYLNLSKVKGFYTENDYFGLCKNRKFLNKLNVLIYKTYAAITSIQTIDTFMLDDDITLIIVVPYDYSDLNDIQMIGLVYNIYKVIYNYLSQLCTVEGGLQNKVFKNYSANVLTVNTLYDVCGYKDIKKIVGLLSTKECPSRLLNDAIDTTESVNDYNNENIININILETGLIERLYQEMLKKPVDEENIKNE